MSVSYISDRQGIAMPTFEQLKDFDKKHDIFGRLCEAFEKSGGCGHDLGLKGALAIIAEWEQIRDPAKIADLDSLMNQARDDETPRSTSPRG